MINNEEVLLSAVAGYPELAVPAGYDNNGGQCLSGSNSVRRNCSILDMRMSSSLKIENHLNCKRLNEKKSSTEVSRWANINRI